MATITKTQSSLLRNALRGNGIFSAASGLIMAVGAGILVQFLGAGTTLFYIVVGIGLLFHAGTLFFNTRTEGINSAFAWYAIIGDVVWVIGTAVILLTDAFNLSPEGKWTLLIIGDIVLTFAIVQYVGLRRMNRV